MTTSNLPVVRTGARGRPEYSDVAMRKFFLGLKGGYSRQAAAGFAGMHRSTIYDRIAKDPDFKLKVEEAEDFAEARYTATVRTAALGDRRDVRAALEWLQRRRPQNWRERVSIDDRGLEPEEVLAEAMEGDALDDEWYRLAEAAIRRRDREHDASAASGSDAPEPSGAGGAEGEDESS